MREILFRGKGDKKYNDGMWYFGVPIRCYDGDWQICTDDSKRTVIPETIGQYTGLKDKNGTKIFEGDIGRRRDDIFLIDWSEEKAAFVMIFYDYICEILYLEEMWDDAEVIGNIHDNPELLEV